jgi:thiazole synthase
VAELGLNPKKVAVERNLEIVPRSMHGDVMIARRRPVGDCPLCRRRLRRIAMSNNDSWTVAGRTFTSRLIVGTGKYKDFEQNAAALVASGAEIITVAVRRVNVSDPRRRC